MSNALITTPLVSGNRLILPDDYVVRAVFDAMGTAQAHIEISMYRPSREYVVALVFAGMSVPPGAFYLGHVVDSFGQMVRHFYAVPV